MKKMNKIEAFREKYGLTREQLGIKMGYSKDHIYRLETGKRNITPHFETALKNVEKLLKL
jgi:DNA-binding XRE family transcriptional regulator